MLPSLILEKSIHLLECSPCAVESWLLQRQHRVGSSLSVQLAPWNFTVADAVLDIALSALIVSGATKVLLPFRLMEFMVSNSPQSLLSSSSHCAAGGGRDGSNICPSSSLAAPLLAGAVRKKWEILTSQAKPRLAILLPSYKHLSSFLQLNESCTPSPFSKLFQQVVIPVPSSPLSSKMLFPEIPSEDFFYQSILPEICQKIGASQTAALLDSTKRKNHLMASSLPSCLSSNAFAWESGSVDGGERRDNEETGEVSWIAWMRSALSCRFEGAFLPPIRLADNTATILSHGQPNLTASPSSFVSSMKTKLDSTVWSRSDEISTFRPVESMRKIEGKGKCAGVIWEEGVANALTPRWMETILKSAVACGVPLSRVTLSLCEKSATSPLTWMKAVEGSVAQFASCSLSSVPLFQHSDSRITLPEIQNIIAGFNESSAIQKEMDEGEAISLMSPDYSSKRFYNSWMVDAAQLIKSREWYAALNETWEELSEAVESGHY